MNAMLVQSTTRPRRQRGTASIEYAIVGALIAVVIAGATGNLGVALLGLYQDVAGKVECALSRTC